MSISVIQKQGGGLSGSKAGAPKVLSFLRNGGGISSPHVVVTNLVPNGGLEVNTAAWSAGGTGTVITRDTTIAHSGVASLRVDVNNAFSNGGNSPNTLASSIIPGVRYTFSLWLFTNQVLPAITLQGFFRDTTGTIVSSFNGTPIVLPVGVWTRVSLNAVAPLGLNIDRANLKTVFTVTTTGTFWIDDAQIELTQSGSPWPYVDTTSGVATTQIFTVGGPGGTKQSTTLKTGGGRSEAKLPATFNGVGNEITDAIRILQQFGDAQPIGSGIGIFQSSTNLVKNGSANVDVANIGTNNVQSIIRETLFPSPFGTSIRIIANGVSVTGIYGIYTVGGNPGTRIPISASTSYTASIWVYSYSATAYRANLEWYDINNTQLSISSSAPINIPANTWTRITVTATSPVGVVGVTPSFFSSTTLAAGTVVLFTGMQLEAMPLVTPYINTAGSSQTRFSGRVRIPATLVTASQGCIALAFRAHGSPTGFPGFFNWGGADLLTNEQVLFYWANTDGKVHLKIRNNGVVIADAPGPLVSLAEGTINILVLKWNSAQISASVNGSTFFNVNISATPNPALLNSLLEILTNNNSAGQLNADLLWCATGVGNPVNASAAAIAALPTSTSPYLKDFPADFNITGIMRATSELFVRVVPAGRATKVLNLIKASGAVSSSVAGVSEIINFVKSGGGIILDSAGGVENKFLRLAKIGGANTISSAGSILNRILNIKNGGSISVGIAGGLYSALKVKIGGGVSVTYAGGLYRGVSSHTGGGIVTGKGGGHLVYNPDIENQWLLSVDLGEATLINASERNPVLLGTDKEIADLTVGKMELPVLKKVRVR